ncbi:MAG: segregation/condensation protein A [Mycoplasma sp.]|nr:segregation/condensation protein A [Mycoplasma sp.]
MENKDFELQINNYNGPLDLLLTLVQSKKMDLFSINLEELANAYLESISHYSEQNIDNASEYLLMATTLLQIKGKMLLEDSKSKEEVRISKSKLVKQLAEYQQFKAIGQKLKEKEELRKNMFIKDNSPYEEFKRPIDETKLDSNSSVEKLNEVLKRMFERKHAQKLREGTISQVNISPEERKEEIENLLKEKEGLSFEEVFAVPSLGHFAVTLLALLDLSRLQKIFIKQDKQFGDITIIKRGNDE